MLFLFSDVIRLPWFQNVGTFKEILARRKKKNKPLGTFAKSIPSPQQIIEELSKALKGQRGEHWSSYDIGASEIKDQNVRDLIRKFSFSRFVNVTYVTKLRKQSNTQVTARAAASSFRRNHSRRRG